MECLMLTLALIVLMAIIDLGVVGVHALWIAISSGFKKKVVFNPGDDWSLPLIINKNVLKNKLTEKQAHAAWCVGLPLLIGLLCGLKSHFDNKGAVAPL